MENLSPLTMKLEEPIRKKFAQQLNQRRIIQRSDAVLALSQQEENDIIQLGWNKRHRYCTIMPIK